MPVQIEPHPEGVVIAVRAQPGARQNGITGEHDGALKVSVTQAPEKGKANKVLVEVLAKELGLKKSQVSLLSGETSQRKKFLLSGMEAREIEARIGKLIGNS
jgi:uncharacterized protein (TIGR00251 family)